MPRSSSGDGKREHHRAGRHQPERAERGRDMGKLGARRHGNDVVHLVDEPKEPDQADRRRSDRERGNRNLTGGHRTPTARRCLRDIWSASPATRSATCRNSGKTWKGVVEQYEKVIEYRSVVDGGVAR